MRRDCDNGRPIEEVPKPAWGRGWEWSRNFSLNRDLKKKEGLVCQRGGNKKWYSGFEGTKPGGRARRWHGKFACSNHRNSDPHVSHHRCLPHHKGDCVLGDNTWKWKTHSSALEETQFLSLYLESITGLEKGSSKAPGGTVPERPGLSSQNLVLPFTSCVTMSKLLSPSGFSFLNSKIAPPGVILRIKWECAHKHSALSLSRCSIIVPSSSYLFHLQCKWPESKCLAPHPPTHTHARTHTPPPHTLTPSSVSIRESLNNPSSAARSHFYWNHRCRNVKSTLAVSESPFSVESPNAGSVHAGSGTDPARRCSQACLHCSCLSNLH